MNIEEKMTENRIIILSGEINNLTANEIILKLLYLDSLNTNDIYLYINSPGGDVFQGFAIIDCMDYIKSKVKTIVMGTAYSMAAVILASGDTRYSLPHSEIMIHEPLTMATSGKATDMINTSNRIKDIRLMLAKKIKEKSNRPLDNILKDMNTDFFLGAKEAKDYGLIDEIINFQSV